MHNSELSNIHKTPGKMASLVNATKYLKRNYTNLNNAFWGNRGIGNTSQFILWVNHYSVSKQGIKRTENFIQIPFFNLDNKYS